MSKVITQKENPEEHKQIMGFVQNYQETKKPDSVDAHFIGKAAIQQFLDNPDFDAFKIHINNRKLLNGSGSFRGRHEPDSRGRWRNAHGAFGAPPR